MAAARDPAASLSADDRDALYRLIADTIPHMVWTARPDGWLDFFNRRCEEYTGLTPSELQGWAWKSVVHEADWERCLDAWTQALRTGQRYEVEYRLRRRDGVYRWHCGTALPMSDVAGRVVRWFGTCTDIDGQIRSAQLLEAQVRERTQALGESERRFQAFMDNSPALAWIKDSKLRYTYVSRPYEEAFGTSAAAILGKDDFQICEPEAAAVRRAHDRAVLASGSIVHTNRVSRDAHGQERHFLVVKFPLADASGETGVGAIGIDITERHELDQALSTSEQRFQTFMEHFPGLAFLRDARERYVYVNRYYEERYCLKREDIIGLRLADVLATDIARRFEEADRRVLATGAAVEYYADVPAPDGTMRRYLTIKFPVCNVGGGTGIGGIAVDVTERHRLETALQRSEERFRTFMDHLPALAWIKDASFRYTFANRAHRRVRGDTVGKDDLEHQPPGLAARFRRSDEAALRLAEGEKVEGVESVAFPDGRPGRWLVVKFPIADDSGARSIGGIAFDVTERAEAEEKIRSYAEDVRRLMNRLVSAQEVERRRVADYLHDLIGQNLTALGIEQSALAASLPAGTDRRIRERLHMMTRLLESTVEAIRGVMTELRPPALEEYGVIAALRWYAREFEQRTGIATSVTSHGADRRLPQEIELALFRIAQEALTNAAKHSGCTTVSVVITHAEGRVQLCVQDNGRGFRDPAGARQAKLGGWGLPAMRERAEAHGGTLRIELPGQGARVIIEIPFDGDRRHPG